MSSDPNMPDFDSMSPEEMMAWMESLAKRQGADASGFTTSADMEVAEIDPSTVDEAILNQKYIPDGWTEERWEAHLAKEEAEKQARLSAQQAQAAAPPPEPEPEPVEAVASTPAPSADATPDFDSMSPEEMMEWMESLAKRQGADEGFTTKAEMQVAEIDPDSVDESIRNKKYVPDGWTEEKWDAYLVEEERKKAERRASQQAQPEPMADLFDDEDDDDEELSIDLPSFGFDEPETEAATDNPMSWLENLASSNDESDDIPDLSAMSGDLGGLADLVDDDDDGDPMDWLASLAGDVDTPDIDLGDMSAGLEGLEAFASGDDDDDDESIMSMGDMDDTDPENFLESLARLQGAPEDELSTDSSTPIPDFLTSLAGDDDDDDDELEFDDILEDTQPSEEIQPAWNLDDPNSIENPEAWLDALAANTGSGQSGLFGDDDDDEQLMFMTDDVEDAEEDEQLMLIDEDDDDVEEEDDADIIQALNKGQDVSPEDIGNFFSSMFERAEQFAHLDEEVDEDEDIDEDVGEAVAIDMPDWLEELSGGVSKAQEVEAEDEAEDEGEDLMADVLAGLDDEDEDVVAEPVGVPDWLSQDSDDDDDDEAEPIDIPDWLSQDSGDDNEAEAEPIEMPDWLTQGAENDTGDVVADIIADELDIPEGETAIISTETGKQVEVDPNDTWTQAFLMEDHEDSAEEWYTQQLSRLDLDGDTDDADVEEEVVAEVSDEMTTVQMTSPPGAASLQPATFPVEEDLPEGEVETAPDWLTGEPSAEPVAQMPVDFAAMSVDDDMDIPDWLESSIDDEDDIEIPDWLNTVEDDSSEELPDWLKDAGVSELEPAAIPDWLTETVEEPVDFIAAEPEPEPVAPPPAAIQPVAQAPIQAPKPAANVAQAIQSAKQKVADNNLDDALQDYESVVRANDQLDVVIGDLQKLTKNDTHKKNPAVYRVLGDALMRHGDLQEALDVYRRALNLL